jgi:hypothetical protein
MRRPASHCSNDQGLTEVVSIALMAILVIAVAAIIASIVFGLVIFYPKSAYIVVQTEAKNVTPDNWYLSVSHMNGDAAYLNHTLTTNNGMPVDFQFTNTTLGTVIPKPEPADGPETWKPGDTLFVYRNQSGYVWVTKNETLARSGLGLPQGVWRFDIVDKTDDVLIYTISVGVGVPTPVNTYAITATSGANGAITPAGITTVNSGGSQSYTISPNPGYHVLDVLVDGSSVGNVTAYQFTNVISAHTISATFAITTYAITATNGADGNVDPAGITMVNSGGSQVYTLTPDPGYHFDVLTVDGNPAALTGPNTYTFTNVQTPHTISATFAINTYTINATSGTNGVVTPAGISTVNYGATPTYTLSPDAGYHVADVLVNGESVGAVTSYTFTSVTANQVISATFAPNAALSITQLNPSSATAGGTGFTLTVTGTGYIHGSIVNWNGAARSTTYVSATQLTATILASDIASAGTAAVTVVNPGPLTSNTATFTINPNTFTITATSGADGTVTPAGITTVNAGATPTYTIMPNAGYHVVDVLVNGGSVGAVTSFTFPPVNSNQVISATFAINTYTITVTAGTGGSISPSGAVSVNYGGSQGFTITPGSGYSIANVVVDGVSLRTISSYTFTNVQAPHTIAATFTNSPPCGTISGIGRVNWEIDCYTRHRTSDTWMYVGKTNTNSNGYYSFSGLIYNQDNQMYELREAAPATRFVDTHLNNGNCYQTGVDF